MMVGGLMMKRIGKKVVARFKKKFHSSWMDESGGGGAGQQEQQLWYSSNTWQGGGEFFGSEWVSAKEDDEKLFFFFSFCVSLSLPFTSQLDLSMRTSASNQDMLQWILAILHFELHHTSLLLWDLWWRRCLSRPFWPLSAYSIHMDEECDGNLLVCWWILVPNPLFCSFPNEWTSVQMLSLCFDGGSLQCIKISF